MTLFAHNRTALIARMASLRQSAPPHRDPECAPSRRHTAGCSCPRPRSYHHPKADYVHPALRGTTFSTIGSCELQPAQEVGVGPPDTGRVEDTGGTMKS